YSDDTVKNEMREVTKDRYLIFTELEACNELGNQYAFFNLFKRRFQIHGPIWQRKASASLLATTRRSKYWTPEKV
ncbi:hypothetical protein, partial [Pseudomonas viridiflava]|uniref:hypothetical protein n=1 Tax=Pseudomonas viridiflava TaxID=33069 RepID=UPI00197F1844